MKLKLIRNVTQVECPWLDREFKEGEIVYEYYGEIDSPVLGMYQVYVTEKSGQTPYFGLPMDSVIGL